MQGSELRVLLVRTRRRPDRTVLVEVSDTGPGIADEVATRLFEPFVTTKAGGMGIGLSISRRIIQSHGSDLIYRRNEHGGATFSFSLPIAEETSSA